MVAVLYLYVMHWPLQCTKSHGHSPMPMECKFPSSVLWMQWTPPNTELTATEAVKWALVTLLSWMFNSVTVVPTAVMRVTVLGL